MVVSCEPAAGERDSNVLGCIADWRRFSTASALAGRGQCD